MEARKLTKTELQKTFKVRFEKLPNTGEIDVFIPGWTNNGYVNRLRVYLANGDEKLLLLDRGEAGPFAYLTNTRWSCPPVEQGMKR